MSKAELIRRLNQAHRETLMLVQEFSRQDFDKKAPGAAWSAKDVFAHLARWNRDARQALSKHSPLGQCGEMPVIGDDRPLPKVMDDLRQSLETLLAAFGTAPTLQKDASSGAVIESVVRHYQTHQNDLKLLIGSFRPH